LGVNFIGGFLFARGFYPHLAVLLFAPGGFIIRTWRFYYSHLAVFIIRTWRCLLSAL
jgi:hypothetical protein